MSSPEGGAIKVLGAILAGGQGRRFGSDKALALLDGRPLIDHAIDALQDCNGFVVCGRSDPSWRCLQDQPRSGIGPLGGLYAALKFANRRAFDAVLTVPCDVPDLPRDLRWRLGSGAAPAYLVGLPVVGLWPSRMLIQLARFLEESPDRSLKAWTRCAVARPVSASAPFTNINTAADLRAYCGG